MQKIENLFFEKYGQGELDALPLVFILGSPRTGSTLIYQLLINFFTFFYFTNFINDNFAQHPIIGAALNVSLSPQTRLEYRSEFGKTQGPFGPSEASLIFREWFGGDHPSQTQSCRVLLDRIAHLTLTLKSIYGLTLQPILVKNAWNCFRIQALTEIFPNIHFIWIRRDIRSSAFSDLRSRYVTKGSPYGWNSATTANYQEIQQRPYWEQVVEQQFEYNKGIQQDLNRFCPNRYLALWYEDICLDWEKQCKRLETFFQARRLPVSTKNTFQPALRLSSNADVSDEDYHKIVEYVSQHLGRFSPYFYAKQMSDA